MRRLILKIWNCLLYVLLFWHSGIYYVLEERWETGNNLPDLDLLIEMANYYEVELKELLDGERKEREKMNDFPLTFKEVNCF